MFIFSSDCVVVLTLAVLDTGRARKALNDAEHSLKLAQEEIEQTHTDLERLFSPEWFGHEGEWKKLDGLCLSKDTGE